MICKGAELSTNDIGHKHFIEAQIQHVQKLFKYFFIVAHATATSMLLMPIVPIFSNYVMQMFNQTVEYTYDKTKLPFDWTNQQFDVTVSPV